MEQEEEEEEEEEGEEEEVFWLLPRPTVPIISQLLFFDLLAQEILFTRVAKCSFLGKMRAREKESE